MSRKALKTLWSFFALFGLTFSGLAFLRTRGQKPDGDAFGILGLDASEVPALALPVQLALLALVLWLTHVWAREAGGPNWASRIPVFYFDDADIDVARKGGQAYQAAVMAVFLFIPLILLVSVCNQYLDASIFFNVKRGATELLPVEGWGHFDTLRIWAEAHGRMGFFRLGTKDGPQYYPAMTWIYAASFVGVVIYFGCLLVSIFRRRSP